MEAITNGPGSTPAVTNLAEDVGKLTLQDTTDTQQNKDGQQSNDIERPLYIYSIRQCLYLSKSPLVKLPDGMPLLKDWFGTEFDPGPKKEQDSASANGRDRRFRRDADDGETTSRPSFRSTLSQPSQMGNFKHQPLRATDRDRDTDKDRDYRDKDGHERLRNLSDKYDRERSNISSLNGARDRGKDRDSAPHLPSGGTRGSNASISMASRRMDGRDANGKKKTESSEDWRRGAGSEAGRRDREDRDKPRSPTRQRDSSTSRRDRDRDDRDRKNDRDEHKKDRDDHRRDRDDYVNSDDDPRRWRDDGKRDERVAARRDRELRDRDRDRDDKHGDRRWTAADGDSRSKRPTGRERRGGAEETRDRDDRRDREREKEKEPAWMDTYIPTTPGGGILGGKNADGDLDGIQAWKKGMKEKEMKEQINAAAAEPSNLESRDSKRSPDTSEPPASAPASGASDNNMDEIQLFKLIMMREGEKKKTGDSPADSLLGEASGLPPTQTSSGVHTPAEKAGNISNPANKSSSLDDPSASLLSLLSSGNTSGPGAKADLPPLTTDIDAAKASGSRFFPTPLQNQSQSLMSNGLPTLDKVSMELSAQSVSPATVAAPQGSRLLALAGRGPLPPNSAKAVNIPPSVSPSTQIPLNPSAFPGASHSRTQSPSLPLPHRGSLSQQGFPQFEEQRLQFGIEHGLHESHVMITPDGLRRASVVTPVDQLAFSGSPDAAFHTDAGPGKGSRFAKFFDGKGRDSVPPMSKQSSLQSNPGYLGGPGMPNGGRQELNPQIPGGNDSRAMEDIMAMLQNSASGQRLNLQSMGPQNNGLYNQPSLAGLQQQPQMHQVHQIPANGLLDSLYESRIDDRHLDDRHFVPDGMVPGLRPSVPVRGGRDLYAEGLDEMQINARLAAQQRGPPEQLYPNQMPMLNPPRYHGGGRGNPVNQQQAFRGGPSPINLQNSLQGMGQQRLPPGLANLGGRPPHDPSQFMNASMGMGPGGMHGQINGNLPSQQAQFNGLNGPGGMGGFAGGPQMRGGPIPGPHQIQNQNSATGLAHLGGIDPRMSTQAQLLAMGLRGGAGANFGGPPQGLGGQLQPGQMQPSMANLRQQPNGPPHPMAHMIPPHLQQQQPQPGGVNNQQAQELMALLMGGNIRE